MPTSNDITTNEQQVDQLPDRTFFDYTYAKTRIDQLVGSWDLEFKFTDYRRRTRNITVDVPALRQQNKLKPDETVIPIRLIDTNIKREEPPKIAYLKQSRRLAIFKPKNTAKKLNTQYLEEEFTRVCQYTGWEMDFIRVIDGAATHGWDSIEIIYDESFPGGFCFDHVGHENLIFPLDARSLEACEFLIRVRHVTCSQLRAFVKDFGFDETQVQKVIESTTPIRQSNTINSGAVPQEDSLREIYKVFFKYNNCIYICWYFKDCENWLLAPKKLFLGRKKKVQEFEQQIVKQPVGKTAWGEDILEDIPIEVPVEVEVDVEEDSFPFKLLPYEQGEQSQIKDYKGRVYKDDKKQEALLALWSSFVNGCTRASNVHGCPKNPSTGAAPKQTNIIIETGKLWSEPIEFFNTPWPDPLILNAAQSLDIQNTQETLQLSYAVNNRQDSRKTAAEVNNVQKDQALINGVQVTLLSSFLRETLGTVWSIVQSLALQNHILFCTVATPEGEFINDVNLIDNEYDVAAAGDVDVVQRAEKLQKQIELLPIFVETALGTELLIDIAKNAFPDEAIRYEFILRQGFQQAQLKAQENEAKQAESEQIMKQGLLTQGVVNMEEKLAKAEKDKATALKTKIEAMHVGEEKESSNNGE